MIQFIEDPILKDFAITLFATGMRKGEGLAITVEDIRGHYLKVDRQQTKGKINSVIGKRGDPITKPPKRGKKGDVLILPFGRKSVRKWAEVEDKEKYRYSIYDVIEKACIKAFPKNKKKRIGVHDLRHSHAIYLLSKGASFTQVALNLRNTVEVCQKYYTGFSHIDETLETLKRIVS